MSKYSVVIGRAESVDLVGLAQDVPAKVDTGAFRSAIHASDVKVVERDGKQVLTCTLLGHPCSVQSYPFEATRFSSLQVKNSSGKVDSRYEVSMRLKIGPKIFSSSFSLSDRTDNFYPILIGRKVLKNRFMVDVTQTGVNRLELKKLKGSTVFDDEEDLE